MRAILIALFFTTAAAATWAEDRIAGVESTIQSQIDAFLQDDFATAFTYASPNIKRMFGSPERFGQMVRNGYPMVWRPADVQFLQLRRQGGSVYQRVLIRDANGAPHVLEYDMIETDQGWQIDGVQFLAPPPVGA